MQATWMHSSTGILTAEDRLQSAAKLGEASSARPAQQQGQSAQPTIPEGMGQAMASPKAAMKPGSNKLVAVKSEEAGDSDDEDIGQDDWDDILAVWMGAVGLPDFIEAAQTDTASESSYNADSKAGGETEQPKPETGPRPEEKPAPAAGAEASQRTAQQPSDAPAAAAALPLLPAASSPAAVQSLLRRPAQAPVLAPRQLPGDPGAAGQLQPQPLDSTAISQYLASYHTGHTNSAGRPMLAVGPQLNTQTSDSLPLLGESPQPSSIDRPLSGVSSSSRGPGQDGAAAQEVCSWHDWPMPMTRQPSWVLGCAYISG